MLEEENCAYKLVAYKIKKNYPDKYKQQRHCRP